MPSLADVGSRIRKTIFSPQRVGSVLTRKSIALFLEIFIFIRPSCGIRRSEISICDITFRRAAILPAKLIGGWETSLSTPSVR